MKIKSKILACFIVFTVIASCFNIVRAEDYSSVTVLHPDAGNIDVNASFLNGIARTYSYAGFNDKTAAANFSVSFSVDGQAKTMRAFCSDHSEAIPMNSPINKVVERAKIMSPGDEGYNMKLAMAVYYGFGGPGDVTGGAGTEDQRVGLTAYACNYAKNGSGDVNGLANAVPQFATLLSHINNCDGPKNIQYLYCNTYAYRWAVINGGWVNCAPWTNSTPLGGTCTDYQALSAFYGYSPMGYLKVTKTLDASASYATVQNAEYGVYKNEACTDLAGKVVIKADGTTDSLSLIAGQYWIKEIKASEGTLLSDSKYPVTITSGNTSTVTTQNKVSYKVRIAKELNGLKSESALDKSKTNYGDAEVQNAKYGVYSNEGCTNLVTTLTIGAGKDAVSDYLPYATYYVKEIAASKGTRLDPNTYTINPATAVKSGSNYIASYDVKNNVTPTELKVIKQWEKNIDITTQLAGKNAKFTLTLNSKPEEKYELRINDDGYLVFKDIPFGTYTLKEEDTGSTTVVKIENKNVELTKDVDEDGYYQMIIVDKAVYNYLKIIKTDELTGKVVKYPGAQFKIYDLKNKKFVSQHEYYPNDIIVDTFVTDETGTLVTPEGLYAGEYVLYEVKAPTGYAIAKDKQVPSEDKLGEGGIKFTIDNTTPVTVIESGEEEFFISEEEFPNKPVEGKIEIVKFGEMLTGAKDNKEKGLDGIDYNVYSLNYENTGLADVQFGIYAKEDITSVDGQSIYYKKGEKVATITTGEDGRGVNTTPIYLGKVANQENYEELKDEVFGGVFEVKEETTPYGYIKDENLADIILKGSDEDAFVVSTSRNYKNEKAKANLEFVKKFQDTTMKYYLEDNKITTQFAIYTSSDIKNVKGTIVVPKDSVVDIIEATTEEFETKLQSLVDLPVGDYYYQELFVSYPYQVDTQKHNFTVKYDDGKANTVVLGPTVVNNPDTTTLTMLKIDETSLVSVVNLADEKINEEELDKKVSEMINEIKGSTKDEIVEYYKENNIVSVSGAKYSIYLDKECTKVLNVVNADGSKTSELVTDENGMISLENLPLGEYYIKEIEAPVGYEISDEVLFVSLTVDNKNQNIFQIFKEQGMKDAVFNKVDIFTGEPVPNCKFEVWDMNENLLFVGTTNEKGDFNIPVENGKLKKGEKYIYREVDAPSIYKENGKLYELNKVDHIFEYNYTIDYEKNTVKFDTKPTVENYRPTSKVTLIKTDDEGNRVPECVFELKSEETGFYEKGVTDKDGIYVFENVPYGKYTYTELEAPAKYNIDTTPHEIEVYGETMTITFVNTGDIAVYTFVAIAIISVLGAAFVLRKRALRN